jgi:hypothetical protein
MGHPWLNNKHLNLNYSSFKYLKAFGCRVLLKFLCKYNAKTTILDNQCLMF